MRLLQYNNDGEFSLTKDFVGGEIPEYAILSHTWGADTEEVTYKDLIDGSGKNKVGYEKIRFCGEQARRDGLHNFWVDTCCIDKSNAIELQRAINSMFRWYHNAARCYVYLSDVSSPAFDTNEESNQRQWESYFRESRWFTRGWTLQELLAPSSVEFFSREGQSLGDKRSLMQQIHEITGIPISALQGSPLSELSFDERISWAQARQTKYEEDMAYSLLGIFGIKLPVIYGEGREKAFKRLQSEINQEHFGSIPRTSATAAETAEGADSLTQRSARHGNPLYRYPEGAEHQTPSLGQPQLPVLHCKMCNILFYLWILLAIASLAVGLWRSFATSDEGKGFTDAAYLVAVGGLVIFPLQNRHALRCRLKGK